MAGKEGILESLGFIRMLCTGKWAGRKITYTDHWEGEYRASITTQSFWDLVGSEEHLKPFIEEKWGALERVENMEPWVLLNFTKSQYVRPRHITSAICLGNIAVAKVRKEWNEDRLAIYTEPKFDEFSDNRRGWTQVCD